MTYCFGIRLNLVMLYVLSFSCSTVWQQGASEIQENSRESSELVALTLNDEGVLEADLGKIPCNSTKKVRFALDGPIEFREIRKGCKCRKFQISPNSVSDGQSALGEFVFRTPSHSPKNEQSYRFELLNKRGEQEARIVFRYSLEGNLSVAEKSTRLDVLVGAGQANAQKIVPLTISNPILAKNLRCSVQGAAFLKAGIETDLESMDTVLVLKAEPTESSYPEGDYTRANVVISDSISKAKSDLLVVMRFLPSVQLHPRALRLKKSKIAKKDNLTCRFLLSTDLGYANTGRVVCCSVDNQKVDCEIEKSRGNLKWMSVSIPQELGQAGFLKIEVKHPESTTCISARLIPPKE